MTISTVYTYPLDGSVRDFNISFEYLARKFVTVTLIGQDRKVLTLLSDYRFTTKTSIQTTVAWGPGNGYDYIEIRRNTSATDRLVDFADGSILRAYELNLSQIQTMHIAEEARNMVADTIGVNNDGQLDARARRLVNLGDAINDGDAVTLRQEKAWAASATNEANRSKAEADRSKSEADRATTQANNSSASATSSANSAASALSSKNAAATSEANALSSKNAAATSESNALASKNAAAASESNAATSATQAANSATQAANSATQASGYAASLNIPGAAGNGGKMLRQKADASGFEYIPAYTAYGLGATSMTWTVVNANDYTTNGQKVYVNPGSTNIPVASTGFLEVEGRGDIPGHVVQTFVELGTWRSWRRGALSGTWGPWMEVPYTGSINTWTNKNVFTSSLELNNGTSDTADIVFNDGTYEVHMDVAGSNYRTYLVRRSDNAVLGFPFMFNLQTQSAQVWGSDVGRVKTTTLTPAGQNYADFAIPSWAKKITVVFEGVKQSTNTHYFIQINGVTTGYLGRSVQIGDYNVAGTIGFEWPENAANNVRNGHMTITRSTTGYVYSLNSANENSNYYQMGSGRLPLTDAPNNLRVLAGNSGTGTFTGGSITVICEG